MRRHPLPTGLQVCSSDKWWRYRQIAQNRIRTQFSIPCFFHNLISWCEDLVLKWVSCLAPINSVLHSIENCWMWVDWCPGALTMCSSMQGRTAHILIQTFCAMSKLNRPGNYLITVYQCISRPVQQLWESQNSDWRGWIIYKFNSRGHVQYITCWFRNLKRPDSHDASITEAEKTTLHTFQGAYKYWIGNINFS